MAEAGCCYAALFVRNSRKTVNPGADRVPPQDRLGCLVLEPRQNIAVTLFIDVSLDRFPLRDEIPSTVCAIIVGVVDVLDDGFSGTQNVFIAHVMEKQEKCVRTVVERFIKPLHFGRILGDESSSRRYRPIHANSLVIGAMPLSPAILLGGLRSRIVVISENVGEGSRTERSGVALVDRSGIELPGADGFDHERVAAEGEARPFIEDLLSAEIGIPRQAAGALESGHGQWS